MSELPEHVVRNRAYWDILAQQYVQAGERAWAQEEPTWGIWQVREAEPQIFSEQLAGKDAIELGLRQSRFQRWASAPKPIRRKSCAAWSRMQWIAISLVAAGRLPACQAII